MEESEKNYRMIFESSPEAIFVLSTDGVLLDVNARACGELGYAREELVGLSITEFPFLDEEGRRRAIEFYAKRLAGEKVASYELTFVARTGHAQVGLVRGALITDEQGIVTKDLLIVGDVTEQKKIADELTTRVAEIEKLNEFMLGREMRVIEVKKEVNELCKRVGEPPRYKG